MRAEQALTETNLRPLVMPLPSQIRAGCGLCLRIDPEHHKRALQALSIRAIQHTGLYLRQTTTAHSTYTPFEEDNP